jgi:hypothetical protein
MRKRSKTTNNTIHYAKAFSQFKELTKLCEDNESLWKDFIKAQENLIGELSTKSYQANDGVLESNEVGIVSFPEIERNHSRGRYKSFFER